MVVVGLAFAILIVVSLVVVANLPKPQIFADHTYFDFGKVPQTKSSHTFTFMNSGTGDLIINRIWTSCGCTTAKVVINGLSSPEFGMPGHGGYEGPWEATLRPGEIAELVVYYDAPSMPDIYIGERHVFVDSNDPATPELQFTIMVEEIP